MSHRTDNLKSFLQQRHNNEDFILDTNVLRDRFFSGKGILEYLYDKSRISQVEEDILPTSIETFDKFIGIIDTPHVYTIKETRDETKTLQSKLADSYRFYKRHSRGSRKDRKGLRLMETLNDKIFELIKTMTSKELHPHGKLYKSVLQCVELVSKRFDGNWREKEKAFDGHEREKPKTGFYLGTDEKIIATALYKSYAEEKDISIITNDERMAKKMGVAYNIISHPELFYSLTKLKERGVLVCRINSKCEIRHAKNPQIWTPREKFNFFIDPKRDKDLKYEIDNILYHGQKDNDPYDKK